MENKKGFMSSKMKKILIICIAVAVLFAGLSVVSKICGESVKEKQAAVAAYNQSVAAVKAAELLGQEVTTEVLDPVEFTSADNFKIWMNNSFRFFFVLAIDLAIVSIAIVLSQYFKKKKKSEAELHPEVAVKTKAGSNSILGIFIALCVLFFDLSLLTDVFLTSSNLINVTQQININFIVAVGMTFVIISGGIDLSIGSNLGVTALFMAMMMNYWNIGVVPTVITGIVMGTVIGLVNGIIITNLELPPFIATLGTMYVGRGLAYTITGGQTISDFPAGFKAITSRVWGLPIYSCLIMIFVFVAGWYVLKYTKLGRYTYAIGGNETCAKLSGINVKLYKTLVYVVSGLCCGIGAVILGSRLDSATVTNADGYEMDAIAAVVIGGSSMSGGEGSIFGTLIGIFIIGFISNGLNLLGVGQGVQKIVKGIIIVIAVVIDVMRRKSASKAK